MINRRSFLSGALAAGTLPLFGIGSARDKVRIAIIGCGDWGRVLLNRAGSFGCCELVALSEVDPAELKKLYKKCSKVWTSEQLKAAKVYVDYRELFEKEGDNLDAVFIATPNHHHALPALLAIRRGIAAYIEKPMAHTMEEALMIEAEAKRTGAVVRVGNKGHNMTHRPKLTQYLKDGVIGDITEVFSYSDRPNTMLHRPPSCPVPEGMNWDFWCGGAPLCEPYAGEDGRVGLHPHDWHSWIDYGNGSIGNMGTHVLDAPYQAMDMWKVTPDRIDVKEIEWGCEGAWQKRETIDFHIPARDGWGDIVLHWNDGIADGVTMGPKYMTGCYNRVFKREHTNFPKRLLELEKEWGVKKPITSFGTVFVGTKGMIYEEFHRTIKFYPEGGKIADIPVPAKDVLDKEEHRIVGEFLDAVRGNPGEINTGLDFSIPLVKTLMLTNALAFAGTGSYTFDGEKTNSAVANEHLKVNYRNGWGIA